MSFRLLFNFNLREYMVLMVKLFFIFNWLLLKLLFKFQQVLAAQFLYLFLLVFIFLFFLLLGAFQFFIFFQLVFILNIKLTLYFQQAMEYDFPLIFKRLSFKLEFNSLFLYCQSAITIKFIFIDFMAYHTYFQIYFQVILNLLPFFKFMLWNSKITLIILTYFRYQYLRVLVQ